MKNECFALVPKDMCLIDSATTYTILKSNKFFSCLIMWDIDVNIIYSTTNIFEDSKKSLHQWGSINNDHWRLSAKKRLAKNENMQRSIIIFVC